MSALDIAKLLRRVGRITETDTAASPSDYTPPAALAGSVQVRHVD